MKKNGNKREYNLKGFTLIELLATITVLGVLMTITLYISTNVISKAKEKSYNTTIVNVEKAASSYLKENSNALIFQKNGTVEYQCVTVQNLIDTGYFDNTALDSVINKEEETIDKDDVIYLERNSSTKALNKSVYLRARDEEAGITACNTAIKANGFISFSVSPTGWSREKNITINYRVKNALDSSDYKYQYKYGSEAYKNSTSSTVNFSVTTTGTAYAKIDFTDPSITDTAGSIAISKIDRIGPTIAATNSSSTVKKNATITLAVTDYGIGLDKSTFTVDDLKVYVGSNLLTKEANNLKLEFVNQTKSGNNVIDNYKLLMTNPTLNGAVTIKINANTVFDKLTNPNASTNITTNVTFDNKYKITYNKNTTDTVTNMPDPASITYTYSSSGTVKLSSNVPKRTGYSFKGWATTSTATTAEYAAGAIFNTNKESDTTLYAIWQANQYKVYYWANGGTGTMEETTCTYDQNCTLRSNSFTRTGYTFDGWLLNNGTVSYSNGATVKNLSSTTLSVTMYAKWKANQYKVYYWANGGTGTMEETTCTYDQNCTLRSNSFTRTGYTFDGWLLNNGTVSYSNGATVKNLSSTTLSVTMYAKWVDTEPPTIAISAKSDDKNYTGNWTNQNVSVTISFDDTGSGIDASSLKWKATGSPSSDWKTISNNSKTTYTDTWSVDRNGVGYYQICDNAKNCSSASFTVKIDKTSPSFSVTNYYYDDSTVYTGGCTTGTVYSYLYYSDSDSGINVDSLRYSSSYSDSWHSGGIYQRFTTTTDESTECSTSKKNCEPRTDGRASAWTYWNSSANTKYLKVCDNAGNCSQSSFYYNKKSSCSTGGGGTTGGNSVQECPCLQANKTANCQMPSGYFYNGYSLCKKGSNPQSCCA